MAPTAAITDRIVQGSPLAAVNDGTQLVIIYQFAEGTFNAYIEPLDGSSVQKDGTNISTITGSPIAAIVVPDGPKINVYYIAKDFTLTEISDFLGTASVTPRNVNANPNAGLAAVAYTLDGDSKVGVPQAANPNDSDDDSDKPVLHITVYYQDLSSNAINGLTWNATDGWSQTPEVVSNVDALVGTALAAAVSASDNTIRLYYQDKGITLQESIFDGKAWSAGQFQPGDVALQGPIATTSVTGEGVLVYYREITGDSYVGRDSAVITTEITKNSRYRHAAVQVKENLRFYYQDDTGNLFYRVSDLDGKSWNDSPAA